jgi:hypothetical protein
MKFLRSRAGKTRRDKEHRSEEYDKKCKICTSNKILNRHKLFDHAK